MDDLDDFVALVRAEQLEGRVPNDPDPFTGDLNPEHDNPAIGPNIHMVSKYVIQPMTRRAGGMSWALMKHREGLPIDLFVSHGWNEGIYEFHRRIADSWVPELRNMWICFLANPQCWDMADLKRLLGKNPLKDSPFAKALPWAKQLLVVPNHAESVYQRLWCVVEALVARENDIPAALASDGWWRLASGDLAHLARLASDQEQPWECAGRVWESQLQLYDEQYNRASKELQSSFVSVRCARSTDPEDERRIRQAIRGHEDEIDDMVRELSSKFHVGAAQTSVSPTASRRSIGRSISLTDVSPHTPMPPALRAPRASSRSFLADSLERFADWDVQEL